MTITAFDPAREEDMAALEAWAFNVTLESIGRNEGETTACIGGDVLDFRDLHRILDWALELAAQRIEARSDETPVEAVQPEGQEPGPKDAPKDAPTVEVRP